MTTLGLWSIGVVRALVELAMGFLLGRACLALLAGSRRHENPIYRLFYFLTQPLTRGLRLLTPAWVVDRHLPLVAFILLFWLWIGLAYLRLQVCQMQALSCL